MPRCLLIRDGVNGACFQPDDPGSLAAALTSLLSQRERWSNLGSQARETIVSRASLSEAADRLDRLYRQLESELTE